MEISCSAADMAVRVRLFRRSKNDDEAMKSLAWRWAYDFATAKAIRVWSHCWRENCRPGTAWFTTSILLTIISAVLFVDWLQSASFVLVTLALCYALPMTVSTLYFAAFRLVWLGIPELRHINDAFRSSEGCRFWVATVNTTATATRAAGERFVGCIGLKPSLDGLATGKLVRMFVEKDYRREGVGARLCKALHDSCVEMGLSSVILTTSVRYPEANKFYAALGYVEEKREKIGWPIVVDETIHYRLHL